MRRGFTLIEMIFVIVIFGILSKFGAELLYKIYENYIYSNTLNRLQNKSELALKQIANRLQYRIKDSTISRANATEATYNAIGDGAEANVTEWYSIDINGWRGTATSTFPQWTGFIDLNASSVANLVSPASVIVENNISLFFIGSNVDHNNTLNRFGWNGAIAGPTNGTDIKVVNFNGVNIQSEQSVNFTDTDVYEFYQLSRSAYAVSFEEDGKDIKDEFGVSHKSGSLWLYHDYKPWLGDRISNYGNDPAHRSLLVDDVISFKFTAIGDIMVIQLCLHDNMLTEGTEGYAICKEKLVF